MTKAKAKKQEDLRILSLTVNSFMGIKLAEVELDGEGGLVIIGGRNKQGKTSVMNAIQAAIQGSRDLPSQPVKTGAKESDIRLDLGELKIRKVIQPDKSVKLIVTMRDGSRPSNPQALLNSLAGMISFDPVSFRDMDPKKQLELVRGLAGVDTKPLDEEAMAVFESRTVVNAQVKAMKGELGAMPSHPGKGYTSVSVTELLKRLSDAQFTNNERTDAKAACAKMNAEIETKAAQHAERATQITEARKSLEKMEAYHANARKAASASAQQLVERTKATEAMPTCDEEPILAEIREAEDTNILVSQNVAHRERGKDLEKLSDRAEQMTEQLKDLATQKRELIASANLPLPGLSFSDAAGVTLGGIPFDQLSASESLVASVAIGAAMDPRLKVMLIRDGSLLDDEAMETLAEVAKLKGYQFWIERVGDGDAGAIVIEGGEIVGAAEPGE